MKFRQQVVNHTPYKNGWNNKRKYITVHETANTGVGANAAAHANLQTRGNSRGAAWHWQVDDKEAVQSFRHTAQLWAAGDGSGNGNNNSIHVEICVNKDGNYDLAVRNAALLVRKIMRDEGIPIQNVKQHNYWSGKNCPSGLRSARGGMTWTKFLKLVKGTSTTTPAASPKIRVGDTVIVKTTAEYYATGQLIAKFVKGSRYKVSQVKASKVLLAGINSWVHKTDVIKT